MKTKSRFLLFVIVCAAGRLAAQNLVVNGGFETGNLTGWTLSQDYGVVVDAGVAAHSGGFVLLLGASVNTDLFQTLETEIGVSYDLSLWLSADSFGDNDNQFTASIGGVDFLTLVDVPGMPFTEYRHTFIATGTATLLNFNHTYGSRFFYLDDVSVTVSPVPEPATWAALAGAAALGLAVCRRRRLARQA